MAIERDKIEAIVRATVNPAVIEICEALDTLRRHGIGLVLKPRAQREPLAPAIDRVLPTSGNGLTARELARKLTAAGRFFAGKPEAQISSTLCLYRKAKGWTATESRPKRWRKTKGGGSP